MLIASASFIAQSKQPPQLVQISFDNFIKVLKKFCSGECCYVNLQASSSKHLKKKLLHRYFSRIFLNTSLTPKPNQWHGSLNSLFLFHNNVSYHNNGGEVILNQYETLEISLRVPHIHLMDLKNKILQKSRFFLKPVFHTTWWESAVTIVTNFFWKSQIDGIKVNKVLENLTKF